MEHSHSEGEDENLQVEFDAHRTIVMWLFFATIILVLFTAVTILFTPNLLVEHPEVLVVLSGILGSFVSALNRIYASKDVFPRGKHTDLFKGASFYLVAYSLIPPLVISAASSRRPDASGA